MQRWSSKLKQDHGEWRRCVGELHLKYRGLRRRMSKRLQTNSSVTSPPKVPASPPTGGRSHRRRQQGTRPPSGVCIPSPIPQSSKRVAQSDYRPIALLSVLSKILEKWSYTTDRYLTATGLPHPSQYAYRSHHSTQDAVLAAVERLITNTDEDLVSSVTTIDLSKAFDSVDHDVVSTKLFWYGIHDVD